MTTAAVPSLTDAYGLHQTGKLDEAARLYAEILRAEPRNSSALYLLGVVHFQRGEYSDAERRMGEALDITPAAIDILYNRARALMKLRRELDAVALFDRMLAINPAIAEAWAGRGKALFDSARNEEALQSFNRAVALDRGMLDAWHNRGLALSALGRTDDALASYGSALAIRHSPETLNNRANLLSGKKRFEEAAADYESILAVNPKFPYARGSLAFCRMQACDWGTLDAERAAIAADLRDGARVAQPGTMLALSDSPEDQLRCATLWTEHEVPVPPAPFWGGERYGHDRIRVAYISADFGPHAVSFLIAGVFEAHDRGRFEISAVALSPDDGSAVRTRIAGSCEHFVDGSRLGDFELATLLRRMEIDIAVDLMGYTGGNRAGIFAHRLAPVQVNYLGFPGTMGAPFMDYIVADETVIPKEHRRHYRENLSALPDCYQCNDNSRRIADCKPSREECGLPESGFVFASFNNSYKFAPEVFGIWMRLLTAVEGSVLWLLDDNAEAAVNLRREAEARGVSASHLVFAPRKSVEEHLARHRLADLFLDTLPYNAHTTASDALWAGLPVLTCLGLTFAGRVAASILNAAGLPELVTHSLSEYEALALKLAREPAALAAMKVKLSANRDACSLFDTQRSTRHLEAAYTTMRERAERGEPPSAFIVERRP